MINTLKTNFVNELKENMKYYKTPCRGCLIDGVCIEPCDKFKAPLNKNVYFYFMTDVRLARLCRYCNKKQRRRHYALYNSREYVAFSSWNSIHLRHADFYDVTEVLNSSTIFTAVDYAHSHLKVFRLFD